MTIRSGRFSMSPCTSRRRRVVAVLSTVRGRSFQQPIKHGHEVALPEGLLEVGDERANERQVEGSPACPEDARRVLQVFGAAGEDLRDEEVLRRKDGDLDTSDVHQPCAFYELLLELRSGEDDVERIRGRRWTKGRTDVRATKSSTSSTRRPNPDWSMSWTKAARSRGPRRIVIPFLRLPQRRPVARRVFAEAVGEGRGHIPSITRAIC